MLDWSAVPSEEVHPGITRQTIQGDRSTVVRYVYRAGAIFPRHAHPEEQTTVVLSGRITFFAEGREIALAAGQSLVVPPNVPHGARVDGDEVVESINVLAPRRERQPGA
ncbi:MAG TPA: cupin domain-containing protein [Chloroflexota bacterium]|jgi:quercetin dioxygenase-like cupin family protein